MPNRGRLRNDFRTRILRAEKERGMKLLQCRRLLHNRRRHNPLTDDEFRSIYHACMREMNPSMADKSVEKNADTTLAYVAERLYADRWDALLGMLPAFDSRL